MRLSSSLAIRWQYMYIWLILLFSLDLACRLKAIAPIPLLYIYGPDFGNIWPNPHKVKWNGFIVFIALGKAYYISFGGK